MTNPLPSSLNSCCSLHGPPHESISSYINCFCFYFVKHILTTANWLFFLVVASWPLVQSWFSRRQWSSIRVTLVQIITKHYKMANFVLIQGDVPRESVAMVTHVSSSWKHIGSQTKLQNGFKIIFLTFLRFTLSFLYAIFFYVVCYKTSVWRLSRPCVRIYTCAACAAWDQGVLFVDINV